MFAEVKSNPLVSIACITFNHESHIRQCLDGFIMQKTNFAYEIVIHDDASTDKTQEIILEYCSKHPKLFRTIFQKDNKYKEGKGILARFVYPECRGKYIALCEGDDYWTDPLKLQKQVDFLEANPEYVMSSHRYQYYYENESRFGLIAPSVFQGGKFDIEYFILNEDWVVQPLTLIFRQTDVDWQDYARYKNSKDSTLAYFLLKKGYGYLLNDVMGVYRIHSSGVWSSISRVKQIASGMSSFIGVCKCEKDIISARCLYNYICSRKSLGKKFILKKGLLLIESLIIISRYMGFKSMIRCLSSAIGIR